MKALQFVLTLLYPLWVFWLVSQQMYLLAAVPLVLMLIWKWSQHQQQPASRLLIVATVLLLSAAAVSGVMEQALLYYPVWINAGLLLVFASSLWRPPTVIERFATLMEGPLTPAARRYTRQVTWVWCLFFCGNGAIAAILASIGNWTWWVWYNGGLSYILMGLLMAAEWLVRQQVKKNHG